MTRRPSRPVAKVERVQRRRSPGGSQRDDGELPDRRGALRLRLLDSRAGRLALVGRPTAGLGDQGRYSMLIIRVKIFMMENLLVLVDE